MGLAKESAASPSVPARCGSGPVGVSSAATDSRFAAVAPVGEVVGLLVAPGGRPLCALTVTVVGGRISACDTVAEPDRPRRVELGVLDPPRRISSPSPTR